MNSLKKLWRIYLFIVISVASSAITFVYFEWTSLVNATTAEIKLQNNVIANAIEAEFDKHRTIMQLMSIHTYESESIKPSSFIKKANFTQQANKIIANNPEILAIGIADSAGDCSLILDHKTTQINIKTRKDNFAFFNEALNNNSLVIGHTQYIDELNEWVVPLFYPLAKNNSTSSTKSAIVLLLDLTNNINVFSKLNYVFPYHFSILRNDFYWQFASHIPQDSATYSRWFNQPLRKDLVDNVKKDIKQQTDETFTSLQDNLNQIVFFNKNRVGKKRIIAIRYNSKYNFFINTSIPNKVLFSRLLPIVISVFILFLVFSAVLLIIFKKQVIILKKSRESLIYQATHDILTDLPNRKYLLNNFDKWLVNQQNKSFHFIYLDLNNFKNSNDLFGHSIGDKILIHVAKVLKSCFKDELCVRHGGDEFIVCLPHKEENELLEQCHDFLEKLIQPVLVDNLTFAVSASIGIANSPKDGKDLDSLLRKADMAMYEAKKHSQQVYNYSTWLEKRTKLTSQLETHLKTALLHEEFSLVYQPQISASDKKIIGVEALIRWQNPLLGNVSPDKFIPIAESTGLINSIGRWVFTTALNDMKAMVENSTNIGQLKNIRLSINVSVHQLLSRQFILDLEHLLLQHDLTGIELMIEITESVFIDDLRKAQSHLEMIRGHNIKISLDDFGTGYSSLSVLHKLPIDEIKIDKSFVRDMLTNFQDKQLVKSIISLSKNLKIPVIAEGVETLAQANELETMGCELFQGYYYAKPLTLEKLLSFIHSS